MRLTASRPFFPCAMRWISGKPLSRKASSSRAGFSSSMMRVLMVMKEKWTEPGRQAQADRKQFTVESREGELRYYFFGSDRPGADMGKTAVKQPDKKAKVLK